MNPTLVRSDLRYWRLTPDARLHPRVLCYFVVHALPESPPGQPDAVPDEELLIPDGYSEIVFNLGAGYERWPVGESAQRDRRAVMRPSYIIGGRSHSVVTRNLGVLNLVGVKLDSRALRALIGTPLIEFRDSTLPLADLNNKALLDLEDAVADARTPVEVAAVLDQFFLEAFRDTRSEDSMIDHLLHRILGARGALSIMDWAREHRVDPRSLERRFCAWTGMTPKQYARIVRFKHSYHRLISGRSGRGPISAYLDGYYDQSHFNRDFKYFVGVPPSARIAGRMRQATSVTDHLLEGELARELPTEAR